MNLEREPHSSVDGFWAQKVHSSLLVDRYFEKLITPNLYLYRLQETVYDKNNEPTGLRVSKDVWTRQEAYAFAKLCGGWILSAQEKVEGLR